jgi:hypothetical protein
MSSNSNARVFLWARAASKEKKKSQTHTIATQ